MELIRAAVAVPRRTRWNRWAVIVAAVLVSTVATNVVLLIRYRTAVSNNPLTQQAEVEAAVQAAVIVPDGKPIISTVADASKLANPALAEVVKNGDKLLIYGDAHRLIIYRPSVNRVVTMLDITNQSTK